MASVVDICNLALAELGDSATVSTIDPPEGSAQAVHCARFYPIARDLLLEMHDWSFSTRRTTLASLTSASPSWEYCYAMPSSTIRVIAVIAADATDDYLAGGAAVPQLFALETLADGTRVIYTDQEEAVARHTVRVTDPTVFSPLFVGCLVKLLSSYLAGPVIKGDAGKAEAKEQLKLFYGLLVVAKASDANQRKIRPESVAPWMAAR